MSFFATQMTWLPFNQMPWIRTCIIVMYMSLNMDTFHPSLSTRASNGVFFGKFDSFCFVDNFECPTCGNNKNFAIVSLVNNTKTPCVGDYITYVLDWTIHWINSFVKGWIGVSSRLRRTHTPICFAQATSLPTIHLYNLSIWVKMTFLLKNGHYIFLSLVCLVWGYLSLEI